MAKMTSIRWFTPEDGRRGCAHCRRLAQSYHQGKDRTGLLWVTMAIVAVVAFMGAAVLISLIIR